MAGYKAKFEFDSSNLEYLKTELTGKAINKVTINFGIKESSQTEYKAHEILFLSRVKEDGEYSTSVTPSDFGVNVFEGILEGENYSFNITRYFFQLLNNEEYTNILYLFSGDGSANANRTILDKSKISINIIYTEI